MSGADARFAAVAVDDKGDVLVVWSRLLPDGNTVIEERARRAGGSFGPVGRLLDEPDAGLAQLVANSRGDVLVLLTTRVPGNCEALGMCAERLRAFAGNIKGEFTEPVELTDDARAAGPPAIGPTGQMAVAWTTFAVNDFGDIVVRRKPWQQDWGSPEKLGQGMFDRPVPSLGRRWAAVAWGTQSLHAAVASDAGPFRALSVPSANSVGEAGAAIAPKGSGVVYWSSGGTSRSAPLYGLLSPGSGVFRKPVRFRGGAGGKFAASDGGLLAFWSQLDRASNIHRAVFDPFASIGGARRGMSRARRLAAHGSVIDGAIDARGRATLLLASSSALTAVEMRAGRRRLSRSRIPGKGLSGITFAEAASGRAASAWLSGKPPNGLRVFAAWR